MILDGVQSRTSLQVDACVSRNKALLHSRGDNSEPYDKIWTPCWAELGKNYVANLEAVQPYWWNAAIFGLAPIPIVWLIIYGIVGIGRWIRRGFSSAAT
jgi:hypothetical protein